MTQFKVTTQDKIYTPDLPKQISQATKFEIMFCLITDN